MTDAELAKIKDIVKIIKMSTPCCCKEYIFLPEKITGHSWICDIHRKAIKKYAKFLEGEK